MKENIGFIGAGNMAQALIEGWLSENLTTAGEVFVSNRTPGKLQRLTEQFKVTSCSTNEEVVDKSDIVILAMKPQDLEQAVEPIASAFNDDQIVISLAAGIQLRKLKRMLPGNKNLVRVMANTPARVKRGTFAYCTPASNIRVDMWMKRMFQPLGYVIKLEEGDPFEAFSVASSAGVGFIYEMMIYWQEWIEEHGVDPAVAQSITVNTFLGTAALAAQTQGQSLEELQAKVTSKKGITHAGLESMRELEVERLLRYSFEKAAIRDRELSED